MTTANPSLPMDVRLMNIVAGALSVIACLAALALATRWALVQPVFAVTRVIVDGDTAHHNDLTLKANVAGRIGGSFYLLDLTQTRAVFESVPWVRRAIVRREFPDRLRVTLEEHQSVGFWGLDSDSRMINSKGEVFEANAGDAETTELPKLMGADGQSATVLSMYRLLTTVLQPYDAVIEQLEMSVRGSWSIELDGGTRINLGRGTEHELVRSLKKFLSAHKQVLASYQRSNLDQVESVDLRNGQGFAIRLRGVSTMNSAFTDKKLGQ